MCLNADQIGFCLHLEILLAFFFNKAFKRTWRNISVWIQKTATTPTPTISPRLKTTPQHADTEYETNEYRRGALLDIITRTIRSRSALQRPKAVLVVLVVSRAKIGRLFTIRLVLLIVCVFIDDTIPPPYHNVLPKLTDF